MSLLTRLFGADRGTHYARGIVHYNRRDYAAALTEFERAVAETGSDRNPYRGLGRFYAAEARTHLGLVHLRTGDYASAEREFEHAVEDNPAYPDRHYHLGVARAGRGDRRAAADAFRAALALNPDYHEARVHLALTLAADGDEDGARAELAACAARGYALPVEIRDPAAPLTPPALEALRAQIDSASRYAAHLEEAVERYQRGDVNGAASELGRAAWLRPGWPDVQCRHGVVLAELGRWDEALAAFERAVAINPAYGEAQLHRGRTFLEMGRARQAAEALEIALAALPDSVEVLGALATAYARTGRTRHAAELARSALTLDARCAPARDALALAYVLDGRPQEAGELLDGAAAVERAAVALAAGRPRDVLRLLEGTTPEPDAATRGEAETELLLGLACGALGEDEAARTHFKRAVACDPSWWPPRLALARAHLSRGDGAAALEALAPVIDGGTENPDVLAVAGDCHRLLDRTADALTLYERAVARHPSHVPALLGRAVSLRALGRDREADEALREVLRRDPLNVAARRLGGPEKLREAVRPAA